PRGDWLMFRYPVIDITIDETQGTTTPLLDLQEIGPAPDDDDLQIDLSQWNQVNMRPSSAANAWAIQARDAFVYGTGRVCLSDYSHFYVRLAAPPSITRQRYLRIAYVMGPPEEWTRQRLSDALSRGQERRVEIPLHT